MAKWFAIESRRIGGRIWRKVRTIKPDLIFSSEEHPDEEQLVIVAFITKEDAKAYINKNMPKGFEAQVVEIDAVVETVYHGTKH
jgi:hypothetical protein